MKRRLLLGGALAITAVPAAVFAQRKPPTVALLWIETSKPSPYLGPLTAGLREHGYVVGRDIRIDESYLVSDYGAMAGAARRLAADKPDVILTYGATSATVVSKATSTIPIVMVSAGDPVGLGLVQSLSRPGGNLTGLSTFNVDLSGKRIELLKEAFPAVRRIAVALYPGSKVEVESYRNYEKAASGLAVALRKVEVRHAAEIEPVVGALGKAQVDAITFVGSTLFRANAEALIAAVAHTRLPAMYVDGYFTERGGLLSYGSNASENFLRSASYIDRILKGANPGDLPIEQPTKVELVVNLKTSAALRIPISRALLQRVDRVIQ